VTPVHTGDGVAVADNDVLGVVDGVFDGVAPMDNVADGDTVTGEPVGVLDGVLVDVGGTAESVQ